MCLLLSISTMVAAENHILLITTTDSNYQQQLSNAIREGLKDTPHQPEVTEASKLDENSISSKELVIAIGKDQITIISKNTFRAAIENVLTESSDKRKHTRHRTNELKIYMTQPLCRQFALIKSLNPDWKTVGLLMSEQNEIKASTLSTCSKQYNLETRTVTVNAESDLITALNTALSNSDVLLSLPDPAIYNSRTIKSILLTSYRHRVPIIGFSESFADAGAIAAVHTSAKQLGTQVADIIKDYFRHDKSFSSAEYYPSVFSVTTNRQVAHSLGFNLQSSKKIEAQLRSLELGNE